MPYQRLIPISRVKLLLIFFLILISLIISFPVYNNIYYLNKLKDLPVDDISSINYSELPKILQNWSTAEKLLSPHALRRLKTNDKIKTIHRSHDNRIVADLQFQNPDIENNAEKRTARITRTFNDPEDLSDSVLVMTGEIAGNILGSGHLGSRMQIEITDINGKKMRGPKTPFIFDNNKIYLILRPTVTEPIPMGSAQDNFDLKSVKEASVLFIASNNIKTYPAQGKILIDNLYLIREISKLYSFPKPYSQRITQDNINFSYRLRKLKWLSEILKFFIGINYPWNNYGWDAGQNPYGEPANSGWSANIIKLKDDLSLLKSIGIEPVRIYIFFDLRTGLKYNAEGKLAGFDDYVRKDIEAMIKTAGKVGIRIIPVLFDFGIADGMGNGVGEHPELIFSSEKYNFLANMMLPLLKDMDKWNKQYGEPIFALELMNEPENMLALLIPGYYEALVSWFQDLANIIHNETSLKVTLGSHSLVDMPKWWNEVDIDLPQAHYYRYMDHEHERWPLNYPRSKISLPGPVIIGELESRNLTETITKIKENGYGGVIVWNYNSPDGLQLTPEQIREIAEWIQKNKN